METGIVVLTFPNWFPIESASSRFKRKQNGFTKPN